MHPFDEDFQRAVDFDDYLEERKRRRTDKARLAVPYYSHGDVQIFHADCRDVLPQLSGVNAVVTDPPYGVGFEGKRTKAGGGRRAELGYNSDFEDTREYVVTVVVPVIVECRQRFGRV